MLFNRVDKKSLLGTLLLICTALQLSCATANPEQRPDRPKGPPPAALSACAELTEGAACSFTSRRGDVEGTCKMPPNGKEGALACAPAKRPAGPPPGREERG